MSVLTPPRHRLVEHALGDARRWCAGQLIDDRPALVHAVRVALTLGEHLPDPDPKLIAAALLHDYPEFAPADLDIDAVLTECYGEAVVQVVRAGQAEHHALDTDTPIITIDERPILLASTADKIVALGSLRWRAEKSGDPVAFFAARPALLGLLPHFQAFRDAGAGRVPASMTRQLGAVLDTLAATARGTA